MTELDFKKEIAALKEQQAQMEARLKEMASPMLSMHAAARYLGIEWDTLRKWVAAGVNVPCCRYPLSTSQPKFKRIDLDRWIDRHRVAARERVRPVRLMKAP